MNQLKDFGFSAQWWRGERGEYWVIGQLFLLIAFILLPVYPVGVLEHLSPLWTYTAWGVTALLGVTSAWLFLWGAIALGTNLTPLPHPKDNGELVTSGVYQIVRHPIYSGVIFGAIAYSCWRWSLTHAIGAIILFIFFDLKARKEELWLKDKFSDYEAYRSQVKKLIPWVY
jgi:protein-S-isoprenylcysteine O-methyltransferase Ste14